MIGQVFLSLVRCAVSGGGLLLPACTIIHRYPPISIAIAIADHASYLFLISNLPQAPMNVTR